MQPYPQQQQGYVPMMVPQQSNHQVAPQQMAMMQPVAQPNQMVQRPQMVPMQPAYQMVQQPMMQPVAQPYQMVQQPVMMQPVQNYQMVPQQQMMMVQPAHGPQQYQQPIAQQPPPAQHQPAPQQGPPPYQQQQQGTPSPQGTPPPPYQPLQQQLQPLVAQPAANAIPGEFLDLPWSDESVAKGMSPALLSFAFLDGEKGEVIDALKAIQLDWFPDALTVRPVDVMRRALDALIAPLGTILFDCYKNLGAFSPVRGRGVRLGFPGRYRTFSISEHESSSGVLDNSGVPEYRVMLDGILSQLRYHLSDFVIGQVPATGRDSNAADRALDRMLGYRNSLVHRMLLTPHVSPESFMILARQFRNDATFILDYFSREAFWSPGMEALKQTYAKHSEQLARIFDAMKFLDHPHDDGIVSDKLNDHPEALETFAVIAGPRILLPGLTWKYSNNPETVTELKKLDEAKCGAPANALDANKPYYLPDVLFCAATDFLWRAIDVFGVAASFHVHPKRNLCHAAWHGAQLNGNSGIPMLDSTIERSSAGQPDTDVLCRQMRSTAVSPRLLNEIVNVRNDLSHGQYQKEENRLKWVDVRKHVGTLKDTVDEMRKNTADAAVPLEVCFDILSHMVDCSTKDLLLPMQRVAFQHFQRSWPSCYPRQDEVPFLSVSRAIERLARLSDSGRVVNGGDYVMSDADRAALREKWGSDDPTTLPGGLYLVLDDGQMTSPGVAIELHVNRGDEERTVNGWLCIGECIEASARAKMDQKDKELQKVLSFFVSRAIKCVADF